MEAEEIATRWAAQEQAVRACMARPGVARLEQLAGLSGMDVLGAISAGELPSPPMGDTLGFVPIQMEPGFAVFQGRPGVKYYNPMGAVHGGWFAALLDTALGCAVHTMLAAGKAYTTLELKINLVRSLTDAVPLVRAEGKLIHLGKQVATAEARLVGPDGKLYAHATTTCLIFDLPSAANRAASSLTGSSSTVSERVHAST